MTSEAPRRLPTLKASMGDWDYFVTSLPFHEVAQRVQPASVLLDPSSVNMNEWIQRRIMPRRVTRIADYLIKQEQHFFPGIVVGVYMGEPTWYEIDIDDQPLFGPSGLDPTTKNTLGVLELDGTEELYAIDGQHRVAGIKEALCRLRKSKETELYERLANETLSIVFVSADIRREGYRERVRRLFTTLNKEAKRVSQAETIALDEDEPSAIVTRWLATRYEGLNGADPCRPERALIQLGTTNEIQANNRYSITTILTLNTFVARTFQRELAQLKRTYDVDRPDEESLERLYEDSRRVWEYMGEYDKAIGEVLGSDPIQERASKYREATGGHILFRPIGLQVFAGALGVLRNRGISAERAVMSLCRLPTDISQRPWRYVLWNPNTRSMVNDYRAVAEALFLHMLGQSPRSRKYDLRSRYNDLLRDIPNDDFGSVQVWSMAD